MNLFGTVLGFTGFFKSRDRGVARVDNIPFRLHYNFSAGFLFLATALLGLNDLFGKEIQCTGINGGAPQAINQYCWVTGTYTVPDSKGADENSDGVSDKPKRCILPDKKHILDCNNADGDCVTEEENPSEKGLPKCAVTQSYYQWVPYILVFQGLVFIIPNKIWTMIEQGKMKSITDGVRTGSIVESETDKMNIIKNISKFIHRQNKSTGHAKYAYGFVLCLILSLINVIFNFYFLDYVFKGKFRLLGYRWIEEHFEMENKLLKTVFPRMTGCVWNDFGTAGGQRFENYVCIMAANVLNEKIFIIIWFWYLMLTVISALTVIYYGVLLSSKSEKIRTFYLQYAVKSSKVKKILKNPRQSVIQQQEENSEVESYMQKLPRSNFFFLYFLAHNVEYAIFKQILVELAKLARNPPEYGMALRTKSISRQNSHGIELRSQTSGNGGKRVSTQTLQPTITATAPDQQMTDVQYDGEDTRNNRSSAAHIEKHVKIESNV